MFDPSTYRDTDFGLERGELFEPEDGGDSVPVDVRKPHVMTVLGPIDPDDLGVCLSHAHIVSKSGARDTLRPGWQKLQLDRAIDELESFAFAGGQSIVDAATADAGRDASVLYGLAQRVPLHIVASTGSQNRIPSTDPGDADELAREFVADLTTGMSDTSALAGIIRVSMKTGTVDGIETVRLRAAAIAHLATGASVAVHLEDAGQAQHTLDVLQGEGVATSRVILQHMDSELSMEVARNVAKCGAWVSFDQIGRGGSADIARARLIVTLFDAGLGDRILIAQDPKSPLSPGSGGSNARLAYLFDWFTLTLMNEGADAELVRSLFVDNPRRALSIIPPEDKPVVVAG